MPRLPERKLNLGDLLILVATSAFAAAMARAYLTLDDYWNRSRNYPQSFARLDQNWPHQFLIFWRFASLLLIPPSLGLLALRLRRPRPTIRRLARQPGFLACVAGPILIAASVACEILVALVVGVPAEPGNDAFNRVVRWWPFSIGTAVFVLWTGAWLARRWRPERSWIDRAGRVIGVLWIACFLSWTWYDAQTILSIAHDFEKLDARDETRPPVDEGKEVVEIPALPPAATSPFGPDAPAKPRPKEGQ